MNIKLFADILYPLAARASRSHNNLICKDFKLIYVNRIKSVIFAILIQAYRSYFCICNNFYPMRLQKINQLFINLLTVISSQVTDIGIKKMKIVLSTDFFKERILRRIKTREFKIFIFATGILLEKGFVITVDLSHKFKSLFLADFFPEVSAKVVCNWEFSVRKSPCSTLTVHN